MCDGMAGLREMSLRPFVRVPLLFLCALPPSRPLSTGGIDDGPRATSL